jgi:hypothetical protein
MDTNLYWQLRGDYANRKKKLSEYTREALEAAILDAEYNDFLRTRSDYAEGESQTRPGGKKLPYIGWYWRHLQFSDGYLPLGNCGDFIGFIANNKWDYPERKTTSEEFEKIMVIIDEAMRLNQEGGNVAEINKNTANKLDELWNYFSTLNV